MGFQNRIFSSMIPIEKTYLDDENHIFLDFPKFEKKNKIEKLTQNILFRLRHVMGFF